MDLNPQGTLTAAARACPASVRRAIGPVLICRVAGKRLHMLCGSVFHS